MNLLFVYSKEFVLFGCGRIGALIGNIGFHYNAPTRLEGDGLRFSYCNGKDERRRKGTARTVCGIGADYGGGMLGVVISYGNYAMALDGRSRFKL